jgi:FkbM family methyltransferase
LTTYLYKITKFILFYFRLTRILIYLLHPNYKKFKIFQRLNLNKNSIFIDIGGNQGIIAQYINDFFNCKIFIYEPHPGCIKVIKRKFQNNKNIFIKKYAVSNINGYSKLYFHSKSKSKNDILFSQSSTLEKNKNNIDKNKFIDIETINIKNVIKSFKYIDAIKIDIEFHEYAILPEIFKNRKKIGKIFCEMHGSKKKYNHLKKKYAYWKKKLIKSNLYGGKFIEWS